MLRIVGIGIAVIMGLTAAAPVQAAVGVNLYGLSWHPSDDDLEWFNPGLGIRYEFLRRSRWKADLVAGGYRDSVGELLVHTAVGAQYRLFGHTYLGGYFMAAAQGYALDEVYLVPLPALTIEAGPVDLNFHFIPRFKGASGSSSVFGFHLAIWPFGGRGEVDTAPSDPDARVGLEFAITTGPKLEDLDGRSISLRWTRNRRHAWRFGVEGYAYHQHTEREFYGDTGLERDSGYSSDSAHFQLLVQHLWLFQSERGTRFTIGLGPRFDYQAGNLQVWAPGAVLSLGAEVDIVDGLTLLAEYTTAWRRQTRDAPPGDDNAVSSLEAGARLGVSIWW